MHPTPGSPRTRRPPGTTQTLEETGQDLADFIDTLRRPAVRSRWCTTPRRPTPLDGVVDLVLAGHTHDREVSVLDDGTQLMVEGSTGGAGLRGLQGEDPTPLSCTVLYLDPATGELTAYDEITLGGLGQSEVTIQRTYVDPLPTGDEDDARTARDRRRRGDPCAPSDEHPPRVPPSRPADPYAAGHDDPPRRPVRRPPARRRRGGRLLVHLEQRVLLRGPSAPPP